MLACLVVERLNKNEESDLCSCSEEGVSAEGTEKKGGSRNDATRGGILQFSSLQL